MPDEELQAVDDSAIETSESTLLEIPQVDAPEEVVADDGTVEVDPETARKLDEAGIELESVDPTDTEEAEKPEESKEVEIEVTDGAVADVKPEPTPEEGDFQQPELVRIDGQLHKVSDILTSRSEAASKIREQGQIVANAKKVQGALDLVMKDPEGVKLVSRLLSGQPVQPVGPEIPAGQEQFQEWIAQDMQANLGVFVDDRNKQVMGEVQRQGQVLNSILAHLEGQVIEKKYDLEPLRPYLDQITQELGVNAPMIPQEMKILLAEGLKARTDRETTETTEQTEEQKEQLETKHREKVTAASVESASNVTNPVIKVVDYDSMTAAEKKKHLIEKMGVRVAERD